MDWTCWYITINDWTREVCDAVWYGSGFCCINWKSFFYFLFFFPHASVVTAKGRGIWFRVNSGSSVFAIWIISVETRRSVWWRCLDIISSIAVWCLAQEIRNHGWIETEIRGDDNGRRKAQSGQTKLKCYSFHPACDHTVLGHAGLTSDPLAVAADERLINPLAPLTPPTL